MDIIIVGCGKVGQKLTEALSMDEDLNITVVDIRNNIVQELINDYDINGVEGSGVSVETLEEAGVKKADILIAVTGSDEINILTCLIAKKKGNCKTIARIRKPEYRNEINYIKDDLGLALVIMPEYAAAIEMARILNFPTAIQIDTFAKGRVEILKFKVLDEYLINGVKLSELNKLTKCDVLICGIERNENVFIPDGDFVIKSGDLISIVATANQATVFFKKIGIKINKVNNTIIVGGGATAYYLAKKLDETGIKVKIIEQDIDRCNKLIELLPNATIINGDGTDNKLLLAEGIEKADSFIALTGIDEENVLLSLFAKTKMKGKVITKINRIAYDDVIDGLDLDYIIYPKNITAEYIERFVRASNNSLESDIETMHFILNEKAEALEFRIDAKSPVKNIEIGKLNLKKNILIACINRKGKIIIPKGNNTIEVGDTVIVVTTNKGYNSISDILAM